MNIVFLVEESVKHQLPISNFLSSSSIYVAPLSELTAIDGQIACKKSPKSLGTLVDGFILGGIAKCGLEGNIDETLRANITEIVPPEFRNDLFFPVVPGREQSGEFVGWLIKRYSLFAGTFAKYSALSDLAAAEMRKLFLETQNALKMAEQELDQAAIPRILLTEHVNCDDLFLKIPPSATEGAFTLSQNSFRPLHSVKRIDLLCRLGSRAKAGVLHVEASGVYSGKLVGSWARSRDKLTQGWNTFVCRDKSVLKEPLHIKVTWNGRSEPPSVGMGVPVAEPTVAAILPGGRPAERPLARRLWRSKFLNAAEIMGETPKSGVIAFDSAEVADEPTPQVPTSDLLSMATYYYGPPRLAASHVEWRSDKAALLVHPAGKQPIIACIKDVEMTEVRRVVARVHLDHPEGAATDFAVFALPQSPETEKSSMGSALKMWLSGGPEREKERLARRLVGEAQWLTLEADQSGEVFFEFSQPYTGSVDLFVATRSPQNISRYAWGFFETLTFEREGQRHVQA